MYIFTPARIARAHTVLLNRYIHNILYLRAIGYDTMCNNIDNNNHYNIIIFKLLLL